MFSRREVGLAFLPRGGDIARALAPDGQTPLPPTPPARPRPLGRPLGLIPSVAGPVPSAAPSAEIFLAVPSVTPSCCRIFLAVPSAAAVPPPDLPCRRLQRLLPPPCHLLRPLDRSWRSLQYVFLHPLFYYGSCFLVLNSVNCSMPSINLARSRRGSPAG
jgi:hypothetical protein